METVKPSQLKCRIERLYRKTIAVKDTPNLVIGLLCSKYYRTFHQTERIITLPYDLNLHVRGNPECPEVVWLCTPSFANNQERLNGFDLPLNAIA
jgi:hypothetical protein